MKIELDPKKLRSQAQILRELVPHLEAAADLADKFMGKKPAAISPIPGAAKITEALSRTPAPHHAKTNGIFPSRLKGDKRAPHGFIPEAVFNLLRSRSTPWRLKEIVTRLGAKEDTISKFLHAELIKGTVIRHRRGMYSVAPVPQIVRPLDTPKRPRRRPNGTAKKTKSRK